MANKIAEGACALCLEPNRLRNSHILPGFLWRRSGITGAGKQFAPAIRYDGLIQRLPIGNGIRERLCCGSCEGKMGEWERYAADYLFRKTTAFLEPDPTAGGYALHGIDYVKFKLFLLSMLWKMGLASHNFFTQVQLGPHQERLRQMMHGEDPGPPWKYRAFASVLTFRGQRFSGVFRAPYWVRNRGRSAYLLVAAGIHIRYEVSSHNFGPDQPPQYLGHEGGWIIAQQDIRDFPELAADLLQASEHRGNLGSDLAASRPCLVKTEVS